MGFDKLWAPLVDRPVLAWTLDAFLGEAGLDEIALVVAQERLGDAAALAGDQVRIVTGGERRRDSVAAGLGALSWCDWVVIHDAARPFVTPDLIRAGVAAAHETGAAVAALPARDTIKRVVGADVLETLSREELYAVQTPQVFRRDLLARVLNESQQDVTDEATLVEQYGGRVRVYRGAATNFKITTQEDMELARALIVGRVTGAKP